MWLGASGLDFQDFGDKEIMLKLKKCFIKRLCFDFKRFFFGSMCARLCLPVCKLNGPSKLTSTKRTFGVAGTVNRFDMPCSNLPCTLCQIEHVVIYP